MDDREKVSHERAPVKVRLRRSRRDGQGTRETAGKAFEKKQFRRQNRRIQKQRTRDESCTAPTASAKAIAAPTRHTRQG